MNKELSTSIAIEDKKNPGVAIFEENYNFPLEAVTKAKGLAGSPQIRHISVINDVEVYEVAGINVNVFVVPPSMIQDL